MRLEVQNLCLLNDNNDFRFFRDLMQTDITGLSFDMCREALCILESCNVSEDLFDSDIERLLKSRDRLDLRKTYSVVLDSESRRLLHDTDDEDSL